MEGRGGRFREVKEVKIVIRPTWKNAAPFTAQIWMGGKVRHSETLLSNNKVRQFINDFCQSNVCCFSVIKADYYYPRGTESGYCIGFINYPQHPRTTNEIRFLVTTLASRLREMFCQDRLSIVFPDEIVTLGEEEVEN